MSSTFFVSALIAGAVVIGVSFVGFLLLSLLKRKFENMEEKIEIVRDEVEVVGKKFEKDISVVESKFKDVSKSLANVEDIVMEQNIEINALEKSLENAKQKITEVQTAIGIPGKLNSDEIELLAGLVKIKFVDSISSDTNDTNKFKKIELHHEGSNVFPLILKNLTENTYISTKKFAIIKTTIPGATFIRYSNGYYGTPMVSGDNIIKGHASFQPLGNLPLFFAAYNLVSFAFAFAHLRSINNRLKSIEQKVGEVYKLILNEHKSIIKAGFELQNNELFWLNSHMVESHYLELSKEFHWWLLQIEEEVTKIESGKIEGEVIKNIIQNLFGLLATAILISNIEIWFGKTDKKRVNDAREVVERIHKVVQISGKENNSKLMQALKTATQWVKLVVGKLIGKKSQEDITVDILLGQCRDLLETIFNYEQEIFELSTQEYYIDISEIKQLHSKLLKE